MTPTIYENGVFETLDVRRPSARALVASRGRILFVGSVAEARALAPHARRIDLGGAHILPGLADTHIHTAQLALQQSEVDLSTAKNCKQALQSIADWAAALASSDAAGHSWIFGGRWNHRLWDNEELPNRRQLDSVTGNRPAAIHHADLHTYWLNTAALSWLGLDGACADPVGGTVVRDLYGSPTGILLESAGFNAGRMLEVVRASELSQLLPRTLKSLIRSGITSIHDIDGADARDALLALHAAGELPLRISKVMPASSLDELLDSRIKSGQGDDWFRYGAVKVFGDGSLSSGTCLMRHPYGSGPSHGLAVTPARTLADLVSRCNENGLAVAVHAIGDRAVSNALDAFENAARETSHKLMLPNRIEHAQHISTRDVPRLAATGAMACMQPASCTTDIEMVDALLRGHDIVSYGWQSIVRAGGKVAFSSDAPVEETNPFHGIYAATTRRRKDGYPAGGWQPEETLTRAQAFEASAVTHGELSGEPYKGTLVKGNLADFIVVDRDAINCSVEDLYDTTVTMTVIGGDLAWSN